ncbi:MAG TPA: hypothetical protein VGE43_19410 [Acidimicrobiales bacterium]
MIVVLVAAVAVLVGVLLVLLWRFRPRPYVTHGDVRIYTDRKLVVRLCDLCEDATATVHLVQTFDDADEAEFAGGRTAMRADYCASCADQLGVA